VLHITDSWQKIVGGYYITEAGFLGCLLVIYRRTWIRIVSSCFLPLILAPSVRTLLEMRFSRGCLPLSIHKARVAPFHRWGFTDFSDFNFWRHWSSRFSVPSDAPIMLSYLEYLGRAALVSLLLWFFFFTWIWWFHLVLCLFLLQVLNKPNGRLIKKNSSSDEILISTNRGALPIPPLVFIPLGSSLQGNQDK
jgi:hypothetical protein